MYTEDAIIFSKYTVYAMIIVSLLLYSSSQELAYMLLVLYSAHVQSSRVILALQYTSTVIAMHILQLCQLV